MSIAQLIRAFSAEILQAAVMYVDRLLGTSDQPSGSSLVGLGQASSLHENTAVIGSHLASQISTNQGAARVYVKVPGGWEYQQLLTDPTGAAGDYLGRSVSVHGDTIVVGAYRDDSPSLDSGSVCIFVRSGTTWTLQQKISPSIASSEYGITSSVHGDTLAVGAPRESAGASYNGAVHVYTRSGITWTLQQKIVPYVTANYLAGSSVSLSGDTLAIGVPGAPGAKGLINEGRVNIYTRSGTTWTLQQSIIVPETASSSPRFGSAVSIDGNSLAIGHNASTDTPVHVYTRSGITWTLQQSLSSSSLNLTTGAALFGKSLSIQGDRLIIGANGETVSGFLKCGCAFLYTRSDGVWDAGIRLEPSFKAENLFYGASAAVYNSVLMVGAPSDTQLGSPGSGSVYVYNLT